MEEKKAQKIYTDFIRFLKEKHVYKNYFKYYNDKNNGVIYRLKNRYFAKHDKETGGFVRYDPTMKEQIKNMYFSSCIMQNFFFYKTKEGENFWKNLSIEWKYYFFQKYNNNSFDV